MNGNDYIDTLHGRTVDQGELEQIVQLHFGLSSSSQPDRVDYQRKDQPPALSFLYDNDEQLQAIVGGEGLVPADIEALQKRIHEILVAVPQRLIGRYVIFCSVPAKKFFRYRDVFQLTPLPSDAPQPHFLTGDHALYLEFGYPGSSDFQIKFRRQARIGNEIELLCGALILWIHGSVGNRGRHHWVIRRGVDPMRSEYCQELYTWPHTLPDDQSFLPTEAMTPASRVPSQEYYTRLGIGAGQELDVPDTIEALLDRFFALSRSDKDRFLRASFWFRHAHRVFTYSQSATLTALVSAIEALMGSIPSSASCPSCGKPTGPGPTALFTQFVEHHAPEISKRTRRELYTLRSKLSHGGHLLYSDRETWGAGLSPGYLTQHQATDTLWRLVRVSLVNWLMSKP